MTQKQSFLQWLFGMKPPSLEPNPALEIVQPIESAPPISEFAVPETRQRPMFQPPLPTAVRRRKHKKPRKLRDHLKPDTALVLDMLAVFREQQRVSHYISKSSMWKLLAQRDPRYTGRVRAVGLRTRYVNRTTKQAFFWEDVVATAQEFGIVTVSSAAPSNLILPGAIVKKVKPGKVYTRARPQPSFTYEMYLEKRDDIKYRIEAGASFNSVAERYKTGGVTIKKHMARDAKENKPKLLKPRKVAKPERWTRERYLEKRTDIAIALEKKAGSINGVAEQFGMSWSTLKWHLNKDAKENAAVVAHVTKPVNWGHSIPENTPIGRELVFPYNDLAPDMRVRKKNAIAFLVKFNNKRRNWKLTLKNTPDAIVVTREA